MYGPSPETEHPMAGFPQVCFIRNTVRNPNIIVGEYTYYDDPENAEDFERSVLYHFPFVGDRLIIGKFCAIARGPRPCPRHRPTSTRTRDCSALRHSGTDLSEVSSPVPSTTVPSSLRDDSAGKALEHPPR